MSGIPGRSLAALLLAGAAGALCLIAWSNAAGRRELDAARRHFEARRLDAARASLDAALERFPRHPDGLTLLGRIRLLDGDLGGAENAWRRAAETSAFPANPLRLLGQTLAASPGRETEGVRALERAFLLAPPVGAGAAQAFLHLGAAALTAGEPPLAAWAFLQAEERGADPSQTRDGLRSAFRAMGAELPPATSP